MNKLTIKAAGVPAGMYRARFVGVEPTNHAEYGPGLRFQFEVATGPAAGRKVSRVTSAVPTVRNAAGKMLSGLAGRPLKPDEDIDLTEFVDEDFQITVEEVQGGGSRVVAVFPYSAE
jgi:hypothetical protein